MQGIFVIGIIALVPDVSLSIARTSARPSQRSKGGEGSGATFAANFMPIVDALRSARITTPASITDVLNAREVPTVRRGRWHVSTAMNLLKRSAQTHRRSLCRREHGA
jgi:hypothetical protein